jgi:hypothetical protein
MLYDMARQIAVANLPTHETPMAATLRSRITTTLNANTLSNKPGVRTGLLLSADAGLGKTTLIRDVAATFDEHQRQLATVFPSVAGHRDRWIPVAWINVPPNVSIKGLCTEMLKFYGDATAPRMTETALSVRVHDLVKACGTRLLVLDDITRMKMHREADKDAADWVRALMETGATILGIGVNVEQSGLLDEGEASARDRHTLTQTRRRFTVHRLDPFTTETQDVFSGWLSHLRAVELDLPLLDKTPGMLTSGDTPAYLLRRTNGVLGTLTRLITEAALTVIGQPYTGPGTGETLTRQVLDSVLLDHAAEHGNVPTDQAPTPGQRQPRRPRTRNGAFNGARRGVA